MQELEQILKAGNDEPYDRYLRVYKLMQDRDKQMQLLFDGHSRNRAPLQLMAIRGEGLADDGLLRKLSTKLADATRPIKK